LWQHVCQVVVCVLRGVHATQHTHHMLPQYCANYNDVILLTIHKKVTLARLNIDSLMMVRTGRNM